MKALQRIMKLRSRPQWAWAMYDWANSAFAATVMAVLLPIYYFDVACADLEPATRTAYWGYTTALSLLIVALISPVMGSLADQRASKKRFLFIMMILGITGTVGLFFIQKGDWLWASATYVVANVGWAGSLVFYDALLTAVASDEESDQVSLAGFALGYLGGGLLLAINMWWIIAWEDLGFSDKGAAVRWSFASVAVWWALFSLPIFRSVAEPRSEDMTTGAIRNSWPEQFISTFRSLKQTLMRIYCDPQLFWFLVAFWLYSDGIGTIMKMSTTYGREIGIAQTQLIAAMLMVQLLGMPLTLLFVPISRRLNSKRALILTLLIYAAVCVLGYFMSAPIHFWILAALVALAQGPSQALSRSIFSRLIPKEQSAEYFSFFSISVKFAGAIGPLLFGIIAQQFGESRLAILSVIIMFVLGMGIIALKLREDV